MAIYELWIESSLDGKYIGCYNRLPPNKNDTAFATAEMETPQAAAQAMRIQLRKALTAADQLRVRGRINIYDNVNDALEDMLRS
ncbi:MAG: hypothetical protein AB1489_10110 [Acidobacteriota bacterium]